MVTWATQTLRDPGSYIGTVAVGVGASYWKKVFNIHVQLSFRNGIKLNVPFIRTEEGKQLYLSIEKIRFKICTDTK